MKRKFQSYLQGYVFSIVPLSPISGEVLMMVYTKGRIDPGMLEFDVSTKKYKQVNSVERADKNYFIILTPAKATIADEAIAALESKKPKICSIVPSRPRNKLPKYMNCF
jgi:hypothetical protein